MHDLGNDRSTAEACYGLATLALIGGDAARAASLFGTSLTLSHHVDEKMIVADALEGLRDERGADGTRGITRAERNHAPTPPYRNRRRREQISREVEDVPRVVFLADTRGGEGDNLHPFHLGEAYRATNANVEPAILGERDRHNASSSSSS